MGVPSFYRWLSNKYPNMVVNAREEKGESVDSSLTNPNGKEFDNLYLDMNGIIHPCFHPDDNLFPPTTYEEVFNNIFEYIDRLFNIVRPRKLLYMAIDGVAPRAKMNQQRSRRFQASKNSEITEKEEERLRGKFKIEGRHVLPKQNSEVSDSNIITPGTDFMYKLSKKLQSYIHLRIENNAGWKKIKVILSDANVPGEGEHKIMAFIRNQRTLSDYNPNTSHVLYGLDADLILLALATHEVHFSILREDVLDQKANFDSASEVKRWFKQDCPMQEQKTISETGGVIEATYKAEPIIKKLFQFLNVWTLRHYLEIDMKITDAPENFKYDLERIIDDFIFICCFVGNDFLPHMPTLEIHEGAVDLLMHVYKREFKNFGGYLIDMQRVEDKKGGYIKLKRVEKFILIVSTYEEQIFTKRSVLRERRVRRILAVCADPEDDDRELDSCANFTTLPVGNCDSSCPAQSYTSNYSDILNNTKDLKEKLKSSISKISDVFKNGGSVTNRVKLGAPGWHERYYKEKFSAEGPENIECIRKSVVQKYTEGLCWVLQYYFSGVPSWTWFYPYQYGPFASDLKGLTQVRVKFQKGLPFKPFDQLMGVLPPRSAHALPKAYEGLMTDEESNISDFYPMDFEVDVEGKRYQWQGICKLPFIDEERLLNETKKLEKVLKEDETKRNSENFDRLFVSSSSELGLQILPLYEKVSEHENKTIKIDYGTSDGIDGFIHPAFDVSSTINSNVSKDGNVLCVFYELPCGACVHRPCLLEGVDFPEKTISEHDIMEIQLWHEYQGNRLPNRLVTQTIGDKRPTNYSKASSKSSSPEVIYKHAGIGWGRGRGKARTVTTNSGAQSNNFRSCPLGQRFARSFSAREELNGPSSSRGAYMRGGNPVISHHGQNSNPGISGGTYKFYGNFEVEDPRGFRNLRISESKQSTNSYGRGNVWESRNRPMPNDMWRQGRGRGQFTATNSSAMKWSPRNS